MERENKKISDKKDERMNLLSVIIENKKRHQLYEDYYSDIKLLYREVLSDWKDIITQPKYTKDMS